MTMNKIFMYKGILDIYIISIVWMSGDYHIGRMYIQQKVTSVKMEIRIDWLISY